MKLCARENEIFCSIFVNYIKFVVLKIGKVKFSLIYKPHLGTAFG